MIKPIVKDVMFLSKKSEEVTQEDKQVISDLKETFAAHTEDCVGMAANMIGYSKRAIIVSMGFVNLVMINPVIVKKIGEYETEEGCLSLVGVRATKRYREIEVRYLDELFKEHTQKYSGYIAQIIQHEVDHLEGVII